MDFGYQLIRLWERPAERLLAAELGVAPLAVQGQLPELKSRAAFISIVGHWAGTRSCTSGALGIGPKDLLRNDGKFWSPTTNQKS